MSYVMLLRKNMRVTMMTIYALLRATLMLAVLHPLHAVLRAVTCAGWGLAPVGGLCVGLPLRPESRSHPGCLHSGWWSAHLPEQGWEYFRNCYTPTGMRAACPMSGLVRECSAFRKSYYSSFCVCSGTEPYCLLDAVRLFALLLVVFAETCRDITL